MQTAGSLSVGHLQPPNDHRPSAYRERYLVVQPLPYRFHHFRQGPSSLGGVLRAGQAVWLEQTIQRAELAAAVRAFVEDLGLVHLDPRWLRKGDGSLSL
jgi:hypothetical protein